jgi:hypothetical protein
MLSGGVLRSCGGSALLVLGRTVLAPTADRTAVSRSVQLVGLGEDVLQLAGWQRRASVSWIGSGGTIVDLFATASQIARSSSIF